MSDEETLFTGWAPDGKSEVKLQFAAYADLAKLPDIPRDNFGHEDVQPPINWQMLANQKWGVCVVAAIMHQVKLNCRMGGLPEPTFTDENVASDFHAITGMWPGALIGADMNQAALYWRNKGMTDSTGKRHKSAACLNLQPGNLRELYAAVYLFGSVSCAFHFYEEWFDQFRAHEAWRITSSMRRTLIGHAVPIVAVRSNLVGVTWSRFQAIRPSAYAYACQQAIVNLSPEALINRKSPEGFDYDALLADLPAVGAL